MGTYASYTDVASRLPYRTIDATSSPSSTEVDAWVTTAEAHVHGALKAIAVSTPVTDSDGIAIIADYVTMFAEGHTRMAYANAGGDGTNDDGKDLVEQFFAFIKEINQDAALWQAMLEGGASSSASARRMRGYVIDNTDSKSVSNGDFAPHFTKQDYGTQF